MLRRWLAVLAVAAPLLLPPAALARISPPIAIHWTGPASASPEPGRPFTARFELVAGAAGVVDGLEISGPGWDTMTLDAPAAMVLARGARRTVELRAVPDRRPGPLTVRGRFEGRVFERTFRFPAPTALGPGRHPIAFVAEPAALPRAPRPAGEAQQIRFHGRFTYTRSDGQVVGADSMTIEIMDDDSPDPIDERIWIGLTDGDGRFDVTVSWSDCDLAGCDDPDVYLVAYAANASIEIQENSLFEPVYSFSTEDQTIDDFTGSEIGFGEMSPSDMGLHPVVHIYNSLRRSWRHAFDRGGMAAPLVETIWDSDGTYYNPADQHIHIQSPEAWVEGTHIHEFGHHLHYSFGHVQYDDGDPGYCGDGHCVWCPESEGNAFAEGFANWFGYTVMNQWQARYALAPVSINDGRYTLETPGVCCADPNAPMCSPNTTLPGLATEGYLAALLRDIEDATNDDHDGGAADCDMDVMTAGDDEIFTVFRDDDPGTAREFVDRFRLRYWEHDQDLHVTARNVDPVFSFPTPVPVIHVQPTACITVRTGEMASFQVVTRGAMNGVTPLKFQWRRNGLPLFDDGVITGSNANTLQISPVNAFLDGEYDCVVTTCNDSFSTQSLAGRLTVLPAAAPDAVVSWGNNQSGMMGTGATAWREPPRVIPNLNLVEVEGGANVAIGLRADGRVLTWGHQQYGELGNGTYTAAQYTPALVPAIDDVLQVRAGLYHKVVLKRDGTVWGWGFNSWGALADSSYNSRNAPVRARPLTECVRALACGAYHTLALLSDGRVLAWGYNGEGALGRGTVGGFSNQPQPVQGLSNVEAIAAAGNLNLALKTDGTVWAWGTNSGGCLGIGQESWVVANSPVPVQVQNLPVIRKIACHDYAGFAISNEGAAYSWGSNQYGLLGRGLVSVPNATTAGLMPGLTLPVQIVTGHGGWAGALQSEGTVHVWGYNYDRVAGRALPSDYMWSPVQVNDVHDVTRIGAAWGTVYALGELTGVTATPDEALPRVLALRASPNPSPGRTRIGFDLPRAGTVSLAVFDLAGRRVRTLVDEVREAGRYDVAWDGDGESPGPRAAGVYFVRLEHGGETRTERLVRMR